MQRWNVDCVVWVRFIAAHLPHQLVGNSGTAPHDNFCLQNRRYCFWHQAMMATFFVIFFNHDNYYSLVCMFLIGQFYKLMIITARNKNIQRITLLDESEVAPSRRSPLNWKRGELRCSATRTEIHHITRPDELQRVAYVSLIFIWSYNR